MRRERGRERERERIVKRNDETIFNQLSGLKEHMLKTTSDKLTSHTIASVEFATYMLLACTCICPP